MSFKYKDSYGNFIGGEFIEPVAGKYFDNISPVNGEVLCRIARSDAKDIELVPAEDIPHIKATQRKRERGPDSLQGFGSALDEALNTSNVIVNKADHSSPKLKIKLKENKS